MPVSFNSIPSNWRQPLYWVEVDPSKAGLAVFRQPALLLGIKITAGSATANVPVAVGSDDLADKYFGQGSELARICKMFFKNNRAQEVWAIPVTATGVAAGGTITVTAGPTDAGIYHLYIAGQHVPVSMTAGMTVSQAAAAINAAINADPELPVTSTVALGVVTLACKWIGASGNDISLLDTYYAGVGGEALPIGLVVAYSGSGFLTSGTGVPSFTTAISNLGEMEADFVCLPYTDSTSLLAWESEFGFGDTGRWGWMRQKFGQIWTAYRATYANMLTFGQSRNSPQVSALGVEVESPAPVYEWAAAYCAKAARGYTNDPARPLQSLHLEGILPARRQDRFLISELNSMSLNGIATQRVESDNMPMISRESTMYRVNNYGNTDDAYTDATTLATLTRLLRNQRQAITSKFPRHKIANDGTRFGAGQAIVTPKSVKAELVAQYRIDEFNGLVEDAASFKDALIVERDPNDPTRLNILYPPDLINGLRLFAVLAQFRLQFNRGVDVGIL
jgi:phage tail sheath gpL-like